MLKENPEQYTTAKNARINKLKSHKWKPNKFYDVHWNPHKIIFAICFIFAKNKSDDKWLRDKTMADQFMSDPNDDS